MSNDSNTKRMSMIVTKGTLDWAVPAFILATTAAAMGLDVTMFFTFYGLTLLKKKLDLKISTLGNPAMDRCRCSRRAYGHAQCCLCHSRCRRRGDGDDEEPDQKEGCRLDRRAAQHGIGVLRQDDRLPDDDGPLRIFEGRHDRRPGPRRRRHDIETTKCDINLFI